MIGALLQASAEADWRAASALLASGVAVVPVGAALLQRVQPTRRVFFARWGFSHLIGAALAGMLVFIAQGVLVEGGALAAVLRNDLYLVAAVGVALVAAHRTQPEGWRSLGAARLDAARSLSFGGVTALFVAPLVIGLAQVWPGWVGDSQGAAALGERVATLGGGARVAAAASLVVVAPLLREAFFRGFAQPLLVQNFSERGGLLLSALVFALIHPLGAFAPAFVLGLACAYAFLRTASLLAPCVVHSAYQALALALALGESGLRLPLL